MGQSLNLEIRSNGEALANVYYKWNGYTNIVAELLAECSRGYYKETRRLSKEEWENRKDMDKTAKRLIAIRMLEAIGAGFPTVAKTGGLSAMDHAKRMYPDAVFNSENSSFKGFIKIHEYGMQETRDYADGEVIINLDDETAEFGCIHEMDLSDESDLKELLKYYEISASLDSDGAKEEALGHLNEILQQEDERGFPLDAIPLESADEFLNLLYAARGWMFIWNGKFYKKII